MALASLSIHYMPAYIAFYADGILLKRINSTQLPDDPVALWFYIVVSSGAPALNATALVKSVSYTLGTCMDVLLRTLTCADPPHFLCVCVRPHSGRAHCRVSSFS
jgi:hypothetical protein